MTVATLKMTMVGIQEMIPYFVWLNPKGGKAIETAEQMDLLCALLSIANKFSLLYLKMHVKWCIHPQESIK